MDMSAFFDTQPANTGNSIAPYQYINNNPPQPLDPAAQAGAYNLDPSILQTTIGSLLQSPAAAQMFLNSLNNSIQGQALQTPQKTAPTPPVDLADPTLALFSPLPNQTALQANQDQLLKSYQDAQGINQDMGKMQESFDSLVRSMGLDLPAETSEGAGEFQMPEDFNMDEFLDHLGAAQDGLTDQQQ